MRNGKKQDKIQLWVFFSLMVFFGIATFVGGVLVLYHNFNTLFAVVPAVPALVSWVLCRCWRVKLQQSTEEPAEPDDSSKTE